MIQPANRLQVVNEYYFSRKLKEISILKSQGKPIINLGVGSPDLSPSMKVLATLTDSLDNENAHQYQSYRGTYELRKAIADFYKRKYDVPLSPVTEILPLLGSKEGIMHISMAFLNPGDEVLVPNPGYPAYQAVAKLLGATPIYYNLDEDNLWLPDFAKLQNTDLSKVKIMWVNYPHMPTGALAPHKFYNELIAFAKLNNILIVNDNPYSFILNDYPRSIFRYPDAKDYCLELNSLSKTFNMSGWRVGMVLGNQDYISAILKVKSNMDSGMFYPIQKAAIEALKSSDMWYASMDSVYEKRREYIWKLAEALNCTFDKTTCGMFVWAKLPNSIKSEDFVDVLLKKYSVFVAPGTVFGSNGEGYIRFSLCASLDEINEAISRIKKI